MVARLFGSEGYHNVFRYWWEKQLAVSKSAASLSTLLCDVFSGSVALSNTPTTTTPPARATTPPARALSSSSASTAPAQVRVLQRANSRLTTALSRMMAENERLTTISRDQALRIEEMFLKDKARALELDKRLEGVEAASALQVNLTAAELFACERKLRTATRLNDVSEARTKKLLDGMTRRHKTALASAQRAHEVALAEALDNGKRNLTSAVEEAAAEREVRQRVESDATTAAEVAAVAAAAAAAAAHTHAAALAQASEEKVVLEAALETCQQQAASGYAAFKKQYRKDWRREEASGEGLSPNKQVCLGTTAHYMQQGERREVPRATALDGGRGSKGKAGYLEKGRAVQVGSSDCAQSTKRRRSLHMNTAVARISSRRHARAEHVESDVQAQWHHHICANKSLYKQLGKTFERELPLEATCTLCNESSGLLGACYRRHLKQWGVKVASKAAVRAHHVKYHHPSCEGKLTIPDPKRPGAVTVAAWLRITNLVGVCQTP